MNEYFVFSWPTSIAISNALVSHFVRARCDNSLVISSISPFLKILLSLHSKSSDKKFRGKQFCSIKIVRERKIQCDIRPSHPIMTGFSIYAVPSLPGGGNPIWKGRGCSSEILNLTPKGDQSGRGPTFFLPLKAIMLNFDHMNRVNKTNWKYIIFKNFFECKPKRDFYG